MAIEHLKAMGTFMGVPDHRKALDAPDVVEVAALGAVQSTPDIVAAWAAESQQARKPERIREMSETLLTIMRGSK